MIIAFWVLLGILGYLIIGAVICGLTGEEDFEPTIMLFWPIALSMFLMLFVVTICGRLGQHIAKIIKDYIYGGKQNENS